MAPHRPQEPHADVKYGGVLYKLAAQHLDVVHVFVCSELEPQPGNRSDRHPPLAFDEATAHADIEYSDGKLACQHGQALACLEHHQPRLTCCSNRIGGTSSDCRRSRCRMSPSSTIGRLSMTQTVNCCGRSPSTMSSSTISPAAAGCRLIAIHSFSPWRCTTTSESTRRTLFVAPVNL